MNATYYVGTKLNGAHLYCIGDTITYIWRTYGYLGFEILGQYHQHEGTGSIEYAGSLRGRRL